MEHTQPDQKQIEWLRSRPWYTSGHDIVNEYLNTIMPGTHIVAHPSDSKEIKSLLSYIKEGRIPLITTPTKENITISKMAISSCHENSMELLKTNKSGCWISGFALSKDMLWRHHSWYVDEQNKITETTESRVMYVECTSYMYAGNFDM